MTLKGDIMQRIPQEPWQVVDELIEQPSWGGRYIIDLKGLSTDGRWENKKVGQSYELSKTSILVDPVSNQTRSLAELINGDPSSWLGRSVLNSFGSSLSLLIKLTQAKGNSFQVHLSEGKTLGHWQPKPEAWFYLAPGLYTFGIKEGTDFEAYSQVLRTIDSEMHQLSHEVSNGVRSVDDARAQARDRILTLNPYAYVNVIHAETDDIVDLTAGGIHHSWEEENDAYPEGNLVYEVQIDVQDELCSMRGFDKGKLLEDGSLRATHVEDYLQTIVNDKEHNELSRHIRKPELISDDELGKVELLFRTPYFNLDRVTVESNASYKQTLDGGFHHLFVLSGNAAIGKIGIEQGKSYFVPSSLHDYNIVTGDANAVILKTYMPTA